MSSKAMVGLKARWIFKTAFSLFGIYWVVHLLRCHLRSDLEMHSTTEARLQTNIMGNIIIPNQKELMENILTHFFKKRVRIDNKENALKIVNDNLARQLLEEKGMGCDIPKTDPFSKEILKFNEIKPKLNCTDKIDWIQCYLTKCTVNPVVFSLVTDLECGYEDITLRDDFTILLAPKQVFKGNHVYNFNVSDHVRITCTGEEINDNGNLLEWQGYGAGFRPVIPKKSPPGREKTYNVLIFAFDSTAKNGFIRKMPKSYHVLKQELKSVIFNGYNVLGDGTPAAIFPILTGKSELELPECRFDRGTKNSSIGWKLDSMPFIFYKMKDDGYRTLYFEDMPIRGTFQYRFNGFLNQPADHSSRAFLLSTQDLMAHWLCLPNTPRYRFMMNSTDQFFQLDGKKFAFTFVGDISHDDFNFISYADEDFVYFLRRLMKRGILNNTLIIVMGDHGPRFGELRSTLQGKLEERLPLMAIRLPDSLIAKRPDVQSALEHNSNVLTTAHDIHETILDVLDMTQHWNSFKIKGADLSRGLTLLKPIPKNRTCSDAGIEAHWCVCLKWDKMEPTNPLAIRVAHILVAKINHMTRFVDNICARRNLTSILWIMHKQNNYQLRYFNNSIDPDGFVPSNFTGGAYTDRQIYQVKIMVSPGNSTYEASVTHLLKTDKFTVSSRDISRTNRYNEEPSCISGIYPHLSPYCYCIKNTSTLAKYQGGRQIKQIK